MSQRARIAIAAALAIAGSAALFMFWENRRGTTAAVGATVDDDARVLQEILGSDPAQLVLHEADQAIDAERPVMAAELIEQAAVPAITRQIDRFIHATVGTQEGRHLRTRAVRLHRARLTAVQSYGRALSRGIGSEDDILLDAQHAYADAERDIAALFDDLAAIRPLASGVGEGDDDRASTLGGLPPLRRDEGPADDDAAPPRPPGEPDLELGEPTEPLPEQ